MVDPEWTLNSNKSRFLRYKKQEILLKLGDPVFVSGAKAFLNDKDGKEIKQVWIVFETPRTAFLLKLEFDRKP